MGKSNTVYELPGESVAVYLDRYTAERLLLALTQALEPGTGQKYYKKKPGKKGKGWGGQSGMKLTKAYKSTTTYGLNLTQSGGTYSALEGAAETVPKATGAAPQILPAARTPRASAKATTKRAAKKMASAGATRATKVGARVKGRG